MDRHGPRLSIATRKPTPGHAIASRALRRSLAPFNTNDPAPARAGVPVGARRWFFGRTAQGTDLFDTPRLNEAPIRINPGRVLYATCATDLLARPLPSDRLRRGGSLRAPLSVRFQAAFRVRPRAAQIARRAGFRRCSRATAGRERASACSHCTVSGQSGAGARDGHRGRAAVPRRPHCQARGAVDTIAPRAAGTRPSRASPRGHRRPQPTGSRISPCATP